jgi:hypothetical protein
LTEFISTRARDAESFSAPDVLAPRRTRFARPQFVLDEQGFVVAAWHEPRRGRVRGAVWRAGSGIGGRIVLGTTSCEGPPRVAGAPAGHVLVGWYGDCSAFGGPASMWAAVRPPGRPIGPAERISELTEPAYCGPDVAIDSLGRGIAAWCLGKRFMASDLHP